MPILRRPTDRKSPREGVNRSAGSHARASQFAERVAGQRADSAVRAPAFTSFDFHCHTRLVFGVNAVERVGELARELGLKKILLITDAGIVKAGHSQRVLDSLKSAGVRAELFDRVHENPTTRDVALCLAAATKTAIDGLIGLGGGSSLDTAKGCNFLLTNGGRMEDYWGVGKATKPMLPLIAIPTTAGTGSECQSFALIANETTHQKMACGDPKAAPRVAILDPALTLSQPARVTACTGIDALAHALETVVTKKHTPLSAIYSREAFRLCHGNLGRVLQKPDDVEARAGMLLGAAFAGLAIENSMLGAAHAAANPLTARFNLIHGHAVGLMLPGVIRFNANDAQARRCYEELNSSPGAGKTPVDKVEWLAASIESLMDQASLPRSLSACGVNRAAIPALAAEAARQWTATFNPRPVTAKDFARLYRLAY